MTILSIILSVALMLPFLAWGIHTLRERYVLHEEIPRKVEVATLCGVALFVIVQLALLRQWMSHLEALYIFTVLSVFVASSALYGHMLISVASQLVVDFVHPPTEDRTHAPRFGPAEALEAGGDSDGALREYMVIARIFPRDAETAFRTGNVLAELSRFDEAGAAFERGLSLTTDSERALVVTNRLSDIYQRELDRMDDARRVLSEYIDRHPNGNRTELVKKKLERMTDLPPIDKDDAPKGFQDSPQADRLG